MKASEIIKGMMYVCEGRKCKVIDRETVTGSGSRPHREALDKPFPDDKPKARVLIRFEDNGEERWVTAEELEPAEWGGMGSERR